MTVDENKKQCPVVPRGKFFDTFEKLFCLEGIRGIRKAVVTVEVNSIVTIDLSLYASCNPDVIVEESYTLMKMENANESEDNAVREVEEDSGGSEDSRDVADSKA